MRTKKLAPVWLFALFLNAFSLVVLAAASKAPAGMTYCPLTKKFQPVKSPAPRPAPLENICADDRDKEDFLTALSGADLRKTNFLDEHRFETLVFDFFQKGKTALTDLPPPPGAPRKKSFKAFSAAPVFGRTGEMRPARKSNDDFSFARNARPPTLQNSPKFDFQTARELKSVARRGNPRAPPFSL